MCQALVRDPSPPLYRVVVGGLRMSNPQQGAWTLREVRAGSLEHQAVFRCIHGSRYMPRTSPDGRVRRVVIQVRTEVALRQTSLDGSEARAYENLVALCAFGEPENESLAWVQTGHFLAERVIYFDGTDRVEDLGLRSAGSNEYFEDHSQTWWIDSRSAHTARYAGRGLALRPSGHSNGEIVYDSPATGRAYGTWLRGRPQVHRIEATIQFRTYLYRRLGGYQSYTSIDPLAVVEWWATEVYARPRPGAVVEPGGFRARVQWVLPNPSPPPDLRSALRQFRIP